MLFFTLQLVDLMEYLVILIIFIFAAGIVYHANVYPNHTVTGSGNIESWPIWTILKIPYWQVYGELYLDTFEGITFYTFIMYLNCTVIVAFFLQIKTM